MNNMNWRKIALHRIITEAVRVLHDTAQLGDDADGPRCHGDCGARITFKAGKMLSDAPKSISHKNAPAFVRGEGL